MRQLLDEHISPQLIPPLFKIGIDAAHVRDRGLLGASDRTVWNYAQSDNRTLVTSNAVDFIPFAEKMPMHNGLILLPGGQLIVTQKKLLFTVVEKLPVPLDPVGNSELMNLLGAVDEAGEVFIRPIYLEEIDVKRTNAASVSEQSPVEIIPVNPRR